MENVEKLKKEISEMRLGKKGGRRRPHKLIMLLAVAKMFDEGMVRDNKIYFDEQLKTTFNQIFEHYQKEDDMSQPSQPFFHLRSAEFWHHQIIEGKEVPYSLLTTSGGGKRRIREHIEYAYLSAYAFEVFANQNTRAQTLAFLKRYLSAIQEGRDEV